MEENTAEKLITVARYEFVGQRDGSFLYDRGDHLVRAIIRQGDTGYRVTLLYAQSHRKVLEPFKTAEAAAHAAARDLDDLSPMLRHEI